MSYIVTQMNNRIGGAQSSSNAIIKMPGLLATSSETRLFLEFYRE